MLHMQQRDSKQEKRGKNLVLVEETIHQSCVTYKYTTPIPRGYYFGEQHQNSNFGITYLIFKLVEIFNHYTEVRSAITAIVVNPD